MGRSYHSENLFSSCPNDDEEKKELLKIWAQVLVRSNIHYTPPLTLSAMKYINKQINI